MTAVPDRFIEIWKKFRKVRIHLSIDDIGERNDYIRYGSKWSQILENFEKIVQYKDVFNLEVCQTVSAYNVHNIDNFKKFTLDYNLVISHNYVHYPSFQQVNVIPEEMKQEILNNIQYMRNDEVDRLKIELFKPKNNNDEEKFFEFVKVLDASRNVKITDYLNEWKKYFE
jgi:sulfatase maturation enzyme AslB (radical SAM superfamily)